MQCVLLGGCGLRFVYASTLPWPCAGECWANPQETVMINYDNLWACPACFQRLGGCQHTTYPDSLGRCISCIPYWDDLNMVHVTMFGTNSMVSSCLREYAVCDKGYYNMSSGAGDYGMCLSCLSVPPVSCGKGRYQKRCIQRQDDTNDLNELCDMCDNPALPDSVKYRYGLGRLYDDCSGISVPNPLLCAWFLTPKWNTGVCDIECNTGYIPVMQQGPYAYPNCTKCETACPIGFKPPYCPGGTGVVAGKIGSCEACADLPQNARWVSGGQSCEWECAVQGFYKGASSCLKCEVVETCTNQTRFMGCNGNSPGRCTACPVSSCQSTTTSAGGGKFSLTYLNFGIYLDRCACVNCSMPVLGLSYAVKNCSTDSDAVLAPCTLNPCFGLPARSHYTAKPCTLWNNSVCAACSAPPSPGRLLISECTPYADAVYGDCPYGLACNGTAVGFRCPEGKIAVGGVCECGPATTLMSGVCVPILCPRSGMYPDPNSGICKNCTLAGSTTSAISKERVMGLDACGCSSGFFVQRLNTSIQCWPCGDLGCTRGLQRQSECLGFGQTEPTCDCGPAPGTELVDTQDIEFACSLRCAKGYHSASTLLPGLYNKFSFISNALPDTSEIVHLLVSVRNIQDVVLVGDNIGVVLHDEGMLSFVRLDSGAVAKTDLNILMGARARFELGIVTAILGHEGMAGYIWIAFTYWGYCDDIDSVLERNCSALELVMLQPFASGMGPFCVGNGVDICMVLTSAIWGNLFPSTGTSAKIYSMTLGFQGGSIFMATGAHGDGAAYALVQYTLTFYQESVPSSERSSDSLIFLGQNEGGGIVDISYGADLLYVMVRGSGGNKILTFSLFANTWADQLDWSTKTTGFGDSQIVQLSEHLLLICGGGQGSAMVVDTLNNIASAFYVSATNSEIPIDKMAFKPNLLVGIMDGGSYLVLYRSATPCPVDTILYEDKSADGCVGLPCVLSKPCGLHSVRGLGQINCVCEPGYFSLSGYVNGVGAASCVPCGQASTATDNIMYDVYCPGGLTAISCPDHSTTSSYLATSISECLCSPGYYHFGSYCLPCPTNMWCPGNGTMTPIPCHAQGTTLYEGSFTPLDCICPTRTYGLLCKPCADGDDCVFIGNPTPGLVSSPSVPTLTSASVRGSGPIWGEEIATSCISQVVDLDNFLIYSIFGADASSLLLSQSAPDILTWNWVFVFRDPPSDAYENISACLGVHGFNIDMFQSLGFSVPGSFLRFSSSCGISNWEWSGLEESPCTCVAGYEARMTITWGIQCFPCLQGTVRQRRSTGGCVPCVGSNEHAPYLGMKECVCVGGFARHTEGGQCVDVRTEAPSWYSDLSSPTIVVTLTVVFGVVFVMGSVLIAFYLF